MWSLPVKAVKAGEYPPGSSPGDISVANQVVSDQQLWLIAPIQQLISSDTWPGGMNELPYRVGFLRRFGLKKGIHFAHFGVESGVVFERTTECMDVFIVSIPNE